MSEATKVSFFPDKSPISYRCYYFGPPQGEEDTKAPSRGVRDKNSSDADEDSDKVVRKNQKSEVQSISGHPEDSTVLALDDSAE